MKKQPVFLPDDVARCRGSQKNMDDVYAQEEYIFMDGSEPQVDSMAGSLQPEMWTVRKEYIYAAITSINDGLGYAEECLQEHDERLGRTTRKNRLWAEIMEKDIAQMRLSLEWLRSLPNIKVNRPEEARVTDHE